VKLMFLPLRGEVDVSFPWFWASLWLWCRWYLWVSIKKIECLLDSWKPAACARAHGKALGAMLYGSGSCPRWGSFAAIFLVQSYERPQMRELPVWTQLAPRTERGSNHFYFRPTCFGGDSFPSNR
jgi:hypothetical protein